MGRRLLLSAALLCSAALPVATAHAASDTGPPLTVPAATLSKALSCTGDLDGATREPVLLVAGTTLTPAKGFSWNYERALTQKGIPWCAITSPSSNMEDIQATAEYVVYAVRRMHARSGRKVEIIGHSQGGMVPRWALKFWPDVRGMVDDLVGLAPSNHGTLDADVICRLTCAPSIWQQQSKSKFLTKLNAGRETYPGIDYTVVYTKTDEVVVPNFVGDASSSRLRDGSPNAVRNVAIQDLCPLAGDEHLALGSFDPTSWALAFDAITHAGPADPKRVSGTCDTPFMPGVDPSRFALDFANELTYVGTTLALYPHTAREPELRSYAR